MSPRRVRQHRPPFGRGLLRQGAMAAGCLLAVSACLPGEEGDDGTATDWSNLPDETVPDRELAGLGQRLETYERVCGRARGDSFAKALCEPGHPPALGNLSQLLELAGLGSDDPRAFALTGNSTSLVARSVSAINPRILVFPRVESDLQRPDTMTAIGFVRGEPFVEIVSRDAATSELNFYLISFERDCSYDAAGCDRASLLTEEIEHDWTAYSVYDHEDLEGTSFDCLSCHRPGGVGSPRILRMQELESPWLHWFPQRFGQQTESDRVLTAQFAEAHSTDTQYGGIPFGTITNALDEGSGAQLEALIRAEGFEDQPNPFDAKIAAEAKSGASSTWDARFQAHLRGEAIAVPYPAIDVTDAMKRGAAVQSYADVVRGLAPRETLLDTREIFSDDASSRLSFVPWSPSDGRAVLLQMCSRCHDGRGDPALAKNAFNVLRLDEMTRETRDRAITRITATGPLRMPPWRVGSLAQDSIDAAVLELRK